MPVQYLYEYLDNVHNLYAFLNDFPAVSREQALKAIRERINANTVISSDRGLCERYAQIQRNPYAGQDTV